jgi:transcriptional regulator with XRE-family HTH domain
MAELLEDIGHNIRQLRDEKRWNQTELGFYADTSPSIISLIENGKRNPSTATLAKIAGALGVQVVDLFPKAHPALPPERGDTDTYLQEYLRLVSGQLERFVSGEDPKQVVAGLAFAASRLVEWSGQEGDEARRISELRLPVIAEADPDQQHWPLERKRLDEGLEKHLKEAPEETPKA